MLGEPDALNQLLSEGKDISGCMINLCDGNQNCFFLK
jgi:hypothetical protein